MIVLKPKRLQTCGSFKLLAKNYGITSKYSKKGVIYVQNF